MHSRTWRWWKSPTLTSPGVYSTFPPSIVSWPLSFRSAKSGSAWVQTDLRAFNIQVVRRDPQTFFGVADLPTPNVSPIIWNNAREPPGVPISKPDMDFFAYLEDAMQLPPDEESLVCDFAVFLLKMLEYDAGRRVIHTRKEMSFYMCGTKVNAKSDVTVLTRTRAIAQYVLLVQEDKYYQSGDEPEPQLIAVAMAAFYQNNFIRYRAGLQPLDSQTFPAITMVGSAPEFYKINITRELLLSVEGGQYPPRATVVEKLLLPVADLANYGSHGMTPLANSSEMFRGIQEIFGPFLSPLF